MSISPSDRDLISAYLDGGIVFASLIPGRRHYKFGVNGMYARFSDSVRDIDRHGILWLLRRECHPHMMRPGLGCVTHKVYQHAKQLVMICTDP